MWSIWDLMMVTWAPESLGQLVGLHLCLPQQTQLVVQAQVDSIIFGVVSWLRHLSFAGGLYWNRTFISGHPGLYWERRWPCHIVTSPSYTLWLLYAFKWWPYGEYYLTNCCFMPLWTTASFCWWWNTCEKPLPQRRWYLTIHRWFFCLCWQVPIAPGKHRFPLQTLLTQNGTWTALTESLLPSEASQAGPQSSVPPWISWASTVVP